MTMINFENVSSKKEYLEKLKEYQKEIVSNRKNLRTKNFQERP